MSIDRLKREAVLCRANTNPASACLVGISGIDSSGKGFVAAKVANELENDGYRVALINVDGWLNLPHVRFLTVAQSIAQEVQSMASTPDGDHFYRYALRLDEMFSRLIHPLKRDRSIKLEMDFAEETATEFCPHTYSFDNIDIVLLEGIFIFKREFVDDFDLKVWVDCTFETALQRAVARGQENMGPDEAVRAYTTIFFPAQLTHFKSDDPRSASDIIYNNE